jgi:hypothetical protein
MNIMKPSDALFIQLIENQEPLHVSRITCSFSEGATQTAFGILRACHLSWLCYDCSETVTVPQPTDIIRTQRTKCRLFNARNIWGSLFSVNWIKSAWRWFHYTDVLWCTVSKTLFVCGCLSVAPVKTHTQHLLERNVGCLVLVLLH